MLETEEEIIEEEEEEEVESIQDFAPDNFNNGLSQPKPIVMVSKTPTSQLN